MNENDIINEEKTPVAHDAETENKSETVSGEITDASSDAPADEAEAIAENEAAEEIVGSEEIADEAPTLTDKTRLCAVTDPMFPTFAKGKDQPLDALISDFIKMKSLGAGEPKPSPFALATPRGTAASPDYALSERQRRIADGAGMSYREYYGFLKTMK